MPNMRGLLKNLLNDKTQVGHEDPTSRRIVNLPWSFVHDDGLYEMEGVNEPPWLYWLLPTVPLVWTDEDDRLQIGGALTTLMDELGRTSYVPMGNRPALANNREIHFLTITLDTAPQVPTDVPPEQASLVQDIYDALGDYLVPTRLCWLGVKMMPPNILEKLAEGTEEIAKNKDSIIEAGKILFGIEASDREMYRDDIDKIKAILGKHGCRGPIEQERKVLESWYNRANGNGVRLQARPSYIEVAETGDRIEFATVRKFNNPIQRGTLYTWASEAAAHYSGAIVISVRGELEPAPVTINRLRANTRKQRSSIKEMESTGDLSDETTYKRFDLQREVEHYLRTTEDPVLMKTSIVMARYAHKAQETYCDMLNSRFAISARPLWHRQIAALQECLPGPQIRLNRSEQPMNIQAVAYSGIGSFGELGDASGIYVGRTDPDQTLCWLDPGMAKAGRAKSQAPGVAILGDPGSGKALDILLDIPTPTGYTKMGDLKVGDQVLDRFGNPCTVKHVSDINETPDLYEITFADGQKIWADWDHQWIASSRRDRSRQGGTRHRDAIARWYRKQEEVAGVEQLARSCIDSQLVTARQALDLLHHHDLVLQWRSPQYVQTALDFVDCPRVTTAGEAWGALPGQSPGPWTPVYDLQTALKCVALRLSQQAGVCPQEGPLERVLTTGDMINEGIVLDHKTRRYNFTIPAPKPLQLPEADLPIDPWLLGAWLGDGNCRTHQMFTHSEDAEETARMVQQAAGVPVRIKWPADDEQDSPNKATIFWSTPPGGKPFIYTLRELDLYCNKHIPMRYLRASYDQRLALLQGLMDSDGAINEKGECFLSLTNQQLAADACDLIRTMGIVVNLVEIPAHTPKINPDRAGKRQVKQIATTWRMCFTTNLPVFRLARKASRVRTDKRNLHQQRIPIISIEPVAAVPGRCIQVDSPDGSYLCGKYLPCHNTFLMQFLAIQSAWLGRSVIFINPKPDDDLSPLVATVGTKCRTELINLSDAIKEPGAFDPFRFAPPEFVHDIATQFITDVLGKDWTDRQQTALGRALQIAVASGRVHCMGDAIAYVDDKEVRETIMELVQSNPLFALAIAMKPKPRLDVQRGLTLIQFDKVMPTVDDEKNASISDRVLLAIMRLIPRAALEILLRSHGGDLYLDEAHRLLSSQAGRSFVERQGREGRSQGIMSVLGTHKPSEIKKAGLEEFMGRFFALKLSNREEAETALELVGLYPSNERVQLMRNDIAPMAPDKATKRPARPAMAFHRDMNMRKGLVSIAPVPEAIRQQLSTSTEDRLTRAMVARRQGGILSAAQQGDADELLTVTNI